jgi:hypothetical protein
LEKSSLTNWIFAGYTGSKNPVQNRLKIQFIELDFSKIKYRSTGGQSSWMLQTVLVIYIFVGSSQLSDHMANEINQGLYHDIFLTLLWIEHKKNLVKLKLYERYNAISKRLWALLCTTFKHVIFTGFWF